MSASTSWHQSSTQQRGGGGGDDDGGGGTTKRSKAQAAVQQDFIDSLKIPSSRIVACGCPLLRSWTRSTIWILAASLWLLVGCCSGDQDAKRLYEDLLTDYNRLIRPVGNNSDRLTVRLGLKLSQLIDVNLKNQIMTTNMWVEQEWSDYKLKWDPEEYGGVKTLHVPSENIWLPDIVLYNNADGNYEVTIMTKAILRYDGTVKWKPPAIYKSFCEINVEYFPFDQQTCYMKFGSWTYDGTQVDLQHLHQQPESNVIEVGIDLREYYLSVEWDIMSVPAQRNEKFYSCCGDTPYPDIFFNITLRRKTLFYTVNLIIPCVGISCLSVLVFYLPADSGEKMSLCVSILLSLTVFFLLLAEIIPSTSLTVPLLGKYLLFTMILVTLSVVVTIAVLNVNFRSPSTHRMAPWVKRVFIDYLPKLLCINRPHRKSQTTEIELNALPTRGTEISIIPVHSTHAVAVNNRDTATVVSTTNETDGDMEIPPIPSASASGDCRKAHANSPFNNGRFVPLPLCPDAQCHDECTALATTPEPSDHLFHRGRGLCSAVPPVPKFLPDEIEHSLEDVRFIAQHIRNKDRFDSVIEDWKFVAMVLDRFFLWVFTVACVAGMAVIILQAPSLYDTTQPIDIKFSKIAQKKLKYLAQNFAFT